MTPNKQLSIFLVILALASIYLVGVVDHKFPLGILLLPLTWFWWKWNIQFTEVIKGMR